MGKNHICPCCGKESSTLAEVDTKLKDGVLTPKGENEQLSGTSSYPETVVCEHCGAEYCEGNLIKQGDVRKQQSSHPSAPALAACSELPCRCESLH